ncbi:ArdC family protein [Thioalkalivibrio thiocyanodenitrificans]|uniref:ArdC family protein n=1 Tax=Thioalkalivibrio thiocyanodenitrificans TaxID=243063 RepID=UPI00037151FB|nr:zincin-like metallopeptidase domain-containing protein [Thioalkalivibrio thiocyanodenitrificans]
MSRKKAARDLYREVTDSVIQALEEGVAPWVKPWDSATSIGKPVNAITNKPYHGINVLILWSHARAQGYAHDRWLTYKQAQSIGANPRKGEHGVLCIYYKMIEKRPAGNDEEAPETFPMARGFTLFNIEQCENLPDGMLEPPALPDWGPVEEAERIAAASGARITEQGVRAFYRPSDDGIRMPPRGAFKDAGAYYSVLLHELVHWTGHKSRLDRLQTGKFGSPDYAFEELIAEMGAAFLSAHCGLEGTLQHPEYIRSWIERLKNDKRELFRALTSSSP